MRRAIALSAFGLGRTSPNPPVGCVVLDREGRVVGEGYHERKGEPHAEVNALAAAGDRARGGIAVVTLEPCNHHGRTPPCRQALLDAGIARTVIALIDPTSREEGGAARLRAAGVDVEVGVLADEARVVLGPWLYSLGTRRPQVTWAYRVGPDGRIRALTDAQVDALSGAVDVVLRGDGHVVEGVPGGHGTDAFHLPSLRAGVPLDDLCDALYDGGARSVLLASEREYAENFLRTGLVREAVVLVSSNGPSSTPSGEGASVLPPGFTLRDVSRIGDDLRLDARPQEQGQITDSGV